ncbi:unnamed protein product [Lymnaea stagnalis]|uniref:Palmitoyltransferase n=1 Tax=Lymnaea stagnalis TaxID=6523 RepID=A0AAV2IBU2_LYMST
MSTQPLSNGGLQAAAFEMLLDAIGKNLSSVIQQLLNSYPNLIHLKGWHGISPLHKACLIGDYNIVLMLIQANSDVNCLTDHQETPLHYASKRGLPSVVHLLVQCGARIQALDNAGRNALHHAAESGSVQVMKYFEEAFEVNMREQDKKLQTPMHITCRHGHLDLFYFLMQKGRTDLRQADSEGNLPLHIACKNGFGHMAWSMLCILGVGSLHLRNNDGYTPLDLALQGDSFGHKELIPVLTYLSQQHESVPVNGPITMWYGWMLYPLVVYSLVTWITQRLASYQFLVYLCACVMAVVQLNGISHRMNHVCRWPNPIYAGFFAAGIIHTSFCYYWLIFPYLIDIWWICLLSVTICPLLHVIFWILIRKEAGAVVTSVKEPVSRKPMRLVDLCMTQNPPFNYCPVCDLVINNMTKHCRLCNRCFLYLDHHCLFLLKCVAAENHPLFLWMLILAIVNMFFFVVGCVLYTLIICPHTAWTEILWQLFHQQAWPLSLCIVNIIFIFWCVGLLYSQYTTVTRGCTSYVSSFEARNFPLTRRQAMTNFIHFLLKMPMPHRNPHSLIHSSEMAIFT